MIQTPWENPFASFLRAADAEFKNIKPERGIRDNASLLPAFVRLSEERGFVFDMVERVRALAMAFDRLHTLSDLYVRSDSRRWEMINAQREADPGRVQFEVPDELHNNLEQCHLEAQLLVTFSYYEMTTVVTLLRPWFVPAHGSMLQYLAGVRNKILTHPRRDGRVKNSRSAISFGPILHAHLVGAEGWIPHIKDHYLSELGKVGEVLDDDTGTLANVACISDPKKKVERLTPEENLRLKAYLIPEPDLLGSAHELAKLLESRFMPEIARVCTTTVMSLYSNP